MTCKKCGNKYHTTDEHEIFKEYFSRSKEDLISVIISLEVENDKLRHKIAIAGGAIKLKKKVKIDYWIKDSRPHSIDEEVENGTKASIHVDEKELIKKDGKLYYNMVCGHGVTVKLLAKS